MNKPNTKLTEAITVALQEMVDDETYAQILQKYGRTDFAVEAVEVNAAKA